jgi:TonB family protein
VIDLASIPWLRAVGWALLHSLWQGALLVGLASVALRLARHRSAEFRYGIAFSTLVAVMLVFTGTLLWLLGGIDPWITSEGLTIVAGPIEPSDLTWTTQLRAFLGPWLPWLCLGWVLGFTFRVVQMGRAMAWLYGPGLGNLQLPPAEWLTRLEALRTRMGLRVPVRLGLSDEVDSLVVLGWLKPVVLVPAAALLALSPETLEVLLIHELEHVRRGDFLANVLQTFAEALLFYHPAVWWLSGRIRQEREHCCDDAAVRACGDSILYASALVRLEELRIQPFLIPDLAPAARGGRLMFRIQRILHPRVSHHPAAPGATLVSAFLLVAGLGVAALSACRAPETLSVAAPVEMDFSKIHIKHQPDPPAYPAEAKTQRIQGTVEVSVTIGPNGRVIDAKALSGPEELHACAVDYAKAWEFEPAAVNGKPVAARFKLTMPFRLK